MNCGLWRALEAMETPAAVLAEWRLLAGADYEAARVFLRPTQRVAAEYPCVAPDRCGCRHEVVEIDETRYLARCQCGMGDCPAPRLSAQDLIVYELDWERFGGAIALALGFEQVESRGVFASVPKVRCVGKHSATQALVFLAICPSEAQLLANLQCLAALERDPFFLLTPTPGHRSEVIAAFLRCHRCEIAALSRFLVPALNGRFEKSQSIQPVLDRFERLFSGDKEPLPSKARFVFQNIGSSWRVIYDGGPEFHIPDGLGAKYLNYLFQHPNEAISAYDLETAIRPEKAKARPKDSIRNGLDPETAREYLRELDGLRAKRDAASEDGNALEADRIEEEIGALELALRQPGLGADAGEKARVNVTKAIVTLRNACLRGSAPEKAFGRHIELCVSTGYEIFYTQPMGRVWR